MFCEPRAIFEVSEPERGAGAAPFSIERVGSEVDRGAVDTPPVNVSFSDNNRMRVEWMYGRDLVLGNDLVYSAAEGLARNVDNPENVYPVRRFAEGKSERVRFGFQSRICRERDAKGGYYFCKPTQEELRLVADMSCEWWIGGVPPEK